MNGLLCINKPAGITSHDVVAAVRRTAGMRRVGHTGTLDPMATGVLPILVGRATRAADFITAEKKAYIAGFTLGIRTDTLDTEGEVTATSDKKATAEDILQRLPQFLGEISQIPPMYSAIKKDGVPLYKLARAGLQAERAPRQVTIYALELLDFDRESQKGTLHIHCSKGTYVRTLCDDLGALLGSYATMHSLIRSENGTLTLEDCVDLAKLTKENIQDFVRPLDSVFSRYVSLFVTPEDCARIKNGVSVSTGATEGETFRVYAEAEFLALGQVRDGRLHILKSFYEV